MPSSRIFPLTALPPSSVSVTEPTWPLPVSLTPISALTGTFLVFAAGVILRAEEALSGAALPDAEGVTPGVSEPRLDFE